MGRLKSTEAKMLGPDSNNTPRALAFAYSTKSAGLELRASPLKALPEGVGFHPSQRETLNTSALKIWSRSNEIGTAVPASFTT